MSTSLYPLRWLLHYDPTLIECNHLATFDVCVAVASLVPHSDFYFLHIRIILKSDLNNLNRSDGSWIPDPGIGSFLFFSGEKFEVQFDL